MTTYKPHHGFTKTSAAPVLLTPMKPVKSIGRDKSRCYCETCDRKRNVCRCERSEK